MKVLRAVGAWFGEHPWVVSVIALSMALIVPGVLQQRSDEANRERDRRQAIQVISDRARVNCENANATQDLVRSVGIQSDVAAAQASTEALITVASVAAAEPPDPVLIAQLRQATIDQATARSTAIYDQLVHRNCKAEERDARREAEKALRG